MYVTIKSLWLALLLAPILLTGVKIPHNNGRHCPFRKLQLDSRTFGVVGSTGLWTRYHSKCLVIVALKLKELKVSQLSIITNYNESNSTLVNHSVDGGKNPSQQRETLPIPQVPIRLTNVWCGRLDGIMDSLPF